MVRSYWKGTLAAALLWPGLAWGQQTPQPAPVPEKNTGDPVITLQEPGKPEQKCRVLRSWQEKGNQVREVQDINTGEVLRVVDGAPVGGHPLVKPVPRVGVISRVFHIDRNAPSAQTPTVPNYRPAGPQPAARTVMQVQASGPATTSNVQHAMLPAPSKGPSAAPASQVVQAGAAEKIIKIQEPGHPAQQCRVLKAWHTPEGYLAREVQDVITGETMTIVDAGLVPVQSGAVPRHAVASRIFHWGTGRNRPTGAPVPPMIVETAQVVSGPCSTGSCGSPSGPCAVANGPCETGNCVTASGPCVSGGTTVVAGPCVSGNCTAATDSCTAGGCSACAPCSPTSDRIVAVPTDGQPAAPVVVSGPTASRPPFWKRWFGSKETVTADCSDCTQPGSTVTASRSPYTSYPGGTKVARDRAAPTDWRRSWGKPDASQALADGSQPSTAPAWPKDFERTRTSATTGSISIPKTPADQNTDQTAPATPPSTAKLAANQPAPAKPAAKQTASAKSTDLPKADKRTLDPLKDPKNISKQPEVKATSPAALAEAAKSVESKFGKHADPKAAPPEPVAQKVVEAGPVGKATTKTKAPLGSQSVIAAYDPKSSGPVCFLPVPVVTLPQRIPPAPPGMATSAEAGKAQAAKEDDSQVNAFTPPGYGGGKGKPVDSPMANAFTGGVMPANTVVVYAGGPGNGMPAGMGRAPMGMMPTPMPISPAGYLPPQRGMMPVMPAVMPPPVPQAVPVSSAGPATPQQLVVTLQNGLYPSQRERAAEALAKCDCKANPEVVDALVLAAREDPAATVRSACVRCLGKISVNSPGVTTALQGLRSDADPQVRQAADEVLGGDGSPKADPAKVQPAGATAPEGEK